MVRHTININNEGDSIEIDIPDVMSIQEWYDQVENFKELQKTIDKSYIKGIFKLHEPETESNPFEEEIFPEEIIPIEAELFSRDIMIELLKSYWTLSDEASERRIQEVISVYKLPIKSREDVKKMVFKAISRYRISPEEVGLKRFPTPGDNNLKDLLK